MGGACLSSIKQQCEIDNAKAEEILSIDTKDRIGEGSLDQLLPQTNLEEPTCTAGGPAASHTVDETSAEKSAPTHELTYQEKVFRELKKATRHGIPDFPGLLERRPSSENVRHDPYMDKYMQDLAHLLELSKEEGWDSIKEQDGVTVYTRPPSGDENSHQQHYFMGQTRMSPRGGLASLLQLIDDTEMRPKYDGSCEIAEVLQSFPPFYKIVRVRIISPTIIIPNRELIIVGRIRFLEDGSVAILMKSVSIPEAEDPKSTRVMANMVIGGYFIRPVSGDADSFDVSWLGCFDAGDKIPSWVSNLACLRQALTLSKMKRFL